MPGPGDQAIEHELERILASPAFRGSRRSQEFLTYVVQEVLRGEGESLKERTIGVALFHRDPGYDTSEDAIVRVKANEVRRRLMQAYQELGHTSEVEIHLPTGSYVPEIRQVQPGVTPVAAPLRTGNTRIWLWLIAALTVVLTVSGLLYYRSRPASAYERFWSPYFQQHGQILICVPHPAVYGLSAAARDSQSATVARADIRENKSDYIGVGDLMAATRFAAHLAAAGREFQVRTGSDTSFAEIRTSPAIFIGAFTNQWTMEMGREFRFVFRKEDGQSLIQDTTDPARRWTHTATTPPSDYAIVSRLLEPQTGRPSIIAAGLGHYGTQAAGEFLTDPVQMDEMLRNLTVGWEKRNLQIVLRVEILGKTPARPKVVTTHVW